MDKCNVECKWKEMGMQDDWDDLLNLHLHLGGRPLSIPGCRCRCRNDWGCSYETISQWFPISVINLYLYYLTLCK